MDSLKLADMVGKVYIDKETLEPVEVTDVGGMRYITVTFRGNNFSEAKLCLPYFEQYYERA